MKIKYSLCRRLFDIIVNPQMQLIELERGKRIFDDQLISVAQNSIESIQKDLEH